VFGEKQYTNTKHTQKKAKYTKQGNKRTTSKLKKHLFRT